MRFLVRLIAAVVLGGILFVGGFVADAVWNRSGLLSAAVGRDALIEGCTPATRESLVGKGFSPTDLVFGDQPSIGVNYGAGQASRSLDAPITFSDGANGPVVNGHVACLVRGRSVTAEVDVDDLPRRVT